MPDGPLGIIGVTLSKADHNKIYALVEARDGGLFSSNDAGRTWRRVNDDRNLRQRAWYYTRLYADQTMQIQFLSLMLLSISQLTGVRHLRGYRPLTETTMTSG
ncbi:MAG: hypothetical protein R2744_00845 [Bacteroidales bacterium]